MVTNYGFKKIGMCRICNSKGYTEVHHIISQSMCDKMERPDLKINQGNLVELCKICHDLTNHSYYREIHLSKNERKKNNAATRARKRQLNGKFVCIGQKKNGERCSKKVFTKGSFCPTHKPSKFSDTERCKHINKKNHRRCRKHRLSNYEFCGNCLQRMEMENRTKSSFVMKGINQTNNKENQSIV